jgi:WD40 repeat protein
VQKTDGSDVRFKFKRALLNFILDSKLNFNLHSVFCNQLLEIHKILSNYSDIVLDALIEYMLTDEKKLKRVSINNNNMPKKSNVHPGLKLRHTLRGHEEHVYGMTLSPDGRKLASPSWDKTVRILDINSGKLVLASGDYWDYTIYLWNPETGELLQILNGHLGIINSVAWSPTRNILASGSADRTIRLWNAETGKTLKILKGHSSSVVSVTWSPDGMTLYSGSFDRTVWLWDAKTGKQIRAFNVLDRFNCVAWSPDGQHIASGL